MKHRGVVIISPDDVSVQMWLASVGLAMDETPIIPVKEIGQRMGRQWEPVFQNVCDRRDTRATDDESVSHPVVKSDWVKQIEERLHKLNPSGIHKWGSHYRWYKAHSQEANAYIAAWQKAHPEQRRLHARPSEVRRKARLKGAIGSFTSQEWKDLVETYQGKCAYCKRKKRLTVDHIIPLSKGGTNYISNIVPACSKCNSSKHNHFWNVQYSLSASFSPLKIPLDKPLENREYCSIMSI